MRLLIGLLLILILSPASLWIAQSQHRAADVRSASSVSASAAAQSGYVEVTGTPSVASPIPCPTNPGISDTACVYSRTTVQTFTQGEKVECGTISTSETVLGPAPDQCSGSDNSSCEKCERVADNQWKTTSDNATFAPFTLGSYTVTPDKTAMFIGDKTLDIPDPKDPPAVGDVKTSYAYLPSAMATLAVGQSSNGAIDTGGDKVFVVSSLSPDATLASLKQTDSTFMWMLTLLSFILMVLGFVFLTAPFEAVFTMVFRFIPVVGKTIDRGITGILHLFSGLVGALVWVVLFVLVTLLKNIFLAFIVAAVIGLIVLALASMMKKNAPPAAPKAAS